MYKGSMKTMKVKKEVHRRIKILAAKAELSMAKIIEKAIEDFERKIERRKGE